MPCSLAVKIAANAERGCDATRPHAVLDQVGEYGIAVSCKSKVAWQFIDGWWWQPGSDTALNSLDLAAHGPFVILSRAEEAA
ncbi:hypothetical protein [Nocardia niigatensis]